MNVNTRKFEFINVEWYEDVDQKPKKKLRARSTDPLLAICYRNLAVNAEENHRYDEASTFRYLAMDTRRHLVRTSPRREKLRVFPFLTLEWWYWVASGYGERILRALSGLIAVWLLFTVFYWNTPFVQRNGEVRSDQEQVIQSGEQVLRLDLGDACIYSLGVMTLQKQEARPVYKTTRLLVLIETVLGPLQAALLALAIRRKFIR